MVSVYPQVRPKIMLAPFELSGVTGSPSCVFNPLKPNEPSRGRTAPLTSKRCILYIYSTNIGTEYFKHGIYSPFFSSSKCSLFRNSNIFSSCITNVLCTGCAKIKKKNNFGAKRLRTYIYIYIL